MGRADRYSPARGPTCTCVMTTIDLLFDKQCLSTIFFPSSASKGPDAFSTHSSCEILTPQILCISVHLRCVYLHFIIRVRFCSPPKIQVSPPWGVAVGPMEDAWTEVLIQLEELTLQGRAERASRESHVCRAGFHGNLQDKGTKDKQQFSKPMSWSDHVENEGFPGSCRKTALDLEDPDLLIVANI